MSPLIFMILSSTLVTSTIITMSSNHWLMAWVGLELNTLSILPIIMKHHHPRATEAATKYFLIQAMAAAWILFASTINAWQTGHWSITNTTNPTATTIITVALLLKLGLAPIHAWYPEVLQGSTFNTAMIMSTWQKLAPLTLLYMTNANCPTNMLLLLGVLSALVGGWAGLNQTQTRKIMALSSIAHMGWLIIALTTNLSTTTMALMVYMILTTSMFTSLKTLSAKGLMDTSTLWSLSPTLTIMMMITLMSLGGLPPLTGFAPKWLIMNHLINTKLVYITITLALATLPSLFFYVRLAYLTTLTTPPTTTITKHNWRFKTNHKQPMSWLLILTMSLLPLTPMMLTT
uniref:NADH-ubiquinone oxidoreductase chain 2 n=1 Tax=Gekko petricolus TaxID=1085618 RepID=G3JW02_9SAUR|nr:NADH dehydrogenase subunit 2 [Gekko petricolus]AEO50783.1 NADH dehydrogenase subunit 2 [Gekko petricolus]